MARRLKLRQAMVSLLEWMFEQKIFVQVDTNRLTCPECKSQFPDTPIRLNFANAMP